MVMSGFFLRPASYKPVGIGLKNETRYCAYEAKLQIEGKGKKQRDKGEKQRNKERRKKERE
jgi:hypothetical protein